MQLKTHGGRTDAWNQPVPKSGIEATIANFSQIHFYYFCFLFFSCGRDGAQVLPTPGKHSMIVPHPSLLHKLTVAVELIFRPHMWLICSKMCGKAIGPVCLKI